ncbi:hypothetical protein [Mesorhizobium sp. B3-2-1]|uniref:hypothetical protein n=1 Tax=Mesorhizobium sp. B3-2-1 TaxID=2589891 RepID=UPI0015E4794E
MTALWGAPRSGGGGRHRGAEKHLAFADTYRMLNNRMSIFVSLPMSKLGKLALQKSLDEIGYNLAKAG